MFIFDEKNTAERIFTRNKALGYKTLVLEPDVTSGCNADISMVDDKIVVTRLEGDESTDDGEPEMTMLLKEFGVFSNIHSKMEITLCDGMLLITLIEGAIDVRIDGQVMLASRNVDIETITCQSLDSVVWVDVERVLSFSKFWCGVNSSYPFDYIYLLDVSGDNSGSMNLAMKPIDPAAFLIDISNGGLAVVEKERQLKEQIESVRNMNKLVTSSTPSTVTDIDDLDYNPEDYMDDDDDDDYDFGAY